MSNVRLSRRPPGRNLDDVTATSPVLPDSSSRTSTGKTLLFDGVAAVVMATMLNSHVVPATLAARSGR